MTPARIAELRALCAAATPGPWEVDGDGRDICGFTDRLGAANGQSPYEITENNGFMRNDMAADAAFIAAARTALPEAIDEIERLRAALVRIATGDALDPDTWATVARNALGDS